VTLGRPSLPRLAERLQIFSRAADSEPGVLTEDEGVSGLAEANQHLVAVLGAAGLEL
jgi:hypothetical protein